MENFSSQNALVMIEKKETENDAINNGRKTKSIQHQGIVATHTDSMN